MLIEIIEQTLAYTLGELNAKIVMNYLERKSCPKQDIPQKLDYFCELLGNVLGSGKGQILGASSILEYAIAEQMSKKLGKKCVEPKPIAFSMYINRLKKEYLIEMNQKKKSQ